MDDVNKLEQHFKQFVQNIEKWIPDGIVEVDLKLLQELDLLDYHRPERKDPGLTRYFHVIESAEKITLVNDHFIVWIVPEKLKNNPITYTFIALNHPETPHLQVAFVASGAYNSSRLVLRVLEKYLQDIQETEEMLHKLSKAS